MRILTIATLIGLLAACTHRNDQEKTTPAQERVRAGENATDTVERDHTGTGRDSVKGITPSGNMGGQ